MKHEAMRDACLVLCSWMSDEYTMGREGNLHVVAQEVTNSGCLQSRLHITSKYATKVRSEAELNRSAILEIKQISIVNPPRRYKEWQETPLPSTPGGGYGKTHGCHARLLWCYTKGDTTAVVWYLVVLFHIFKIFSLSETKVAFKYSIRDIIQN